LTIGSVASCNLNFLPAPRAARSAVTKTASVDESMNSTPLRSATTSSCVTSNESRSSLSVGLDDHAGGTGWHEAEKAVGTHFRWMGRVATLPIPYVASAGDDIVLEVDGFAHVAKEVAKDLVCSVNGVQLEGSVSMGWGRKWTYVSKPFPGALCSEMVPSRIMFEAGGADAYQNGSDTRYLTVAIAKVRLRRV